MPDYNQPTTQQGKNIIPKIYEPKKVEEKPRTNFADNYSSDSLSFGKPYSGPTIARVL